MTVGVRGIAARRAARQRITVAGGPDLSIKTLGQARIESPLAALLAALAVSKRNQVDPHGDLWMSVLEATGQPVRFGGVEGESAPS